MLLIQYVYDMLDCWCSIKFKSFLIGLINFQSCVSTFGRTKCISNQIWLRVLLRLKCVLLRRFKESADSVVSGTGATHADRASVKSQIRSDSFGVRCGRMCALIWLSLSNLAFETCAGIERIARTGKMRWTGSVCVCPIP